MVQGSRSGSRRPSGLRLLLYRFPAWAYRLGLGWLLAWPILGFRFLMIAHRGRRSGRAYYTVVELVRHDRTADEYIVASGYGSVSDWYRNLRASPPLWIQVGGRRYRVAQRFLAPSEVYQEFVDYERRHPRAARALPRLLGLSYDGSEAQRQTVARELPMVAFHPAGRIGQPDRTGFTP